EEEDTGEIVVQSVTGNIGLNSVFFRYPNTDKNTLTNINLQINAGETIALVGSSGSGKTTLANLIPRFYLPYRGSITLDGYNLDNLSRLSLRAQIALVSQEVVLFNDTIYNNVAYGSNNKCSSTEVYNAVR